MRFERQLDPQQKIFHSLPSCENLQRKHHFRIELCLRLSEHFAIIPCWLRRFHATAANERFFTAGSRRGVAVRTTDLTISRCRFTDYAKKKYSKMRAARAARFNIIDFWRFRWFFRRRFPSTSPMS